MIGSGVLRISGDRFGFLADATGGPYVLTPQYVVGIDVMPVAVEEEVVLDDRWNPKAWAQWFREFLQEKFLDKFFARDSVEETGGGRRHLIGRGVGSGREATPHRCRSSPLWQREWKMKLWVQSL
jgi:hypothetical protein